MSFNFSVASSSVNVPETQSVTKSDFTGILAIVLLALTSTILVSLTCVILAIKTCKTRPKIEEPVNVCQAQIVVEEQKVDQVV